MRNFNTVQVHDLKYLTFWSILSGVLGVMSGYRSQRSEMKLSFNILPQVNKNSVAW